MVWWFVVAFVVALVVAVSLQPKPQNQAPLGLGDVRAPTAEEGREIPVIFGTREVEGPNVVWYGHLKTVAVKKKGGKK